MRHVPGSEGGSNFFGIISRTAAGAGGSGAVVEGGQHIGAKARGDVDSMVVGSNFFGKVVAPIRGGVSRAAAAADGSSLFASVVNANEVQGHRGATGEAMGAGDAGGGQAGNSFGLVARPHAEFGLGGGGGGVGFGDKGGVGGGHGGDHVGAPAVAAPAGVGAHASGASGPLVHGHWGGDGGFFGSMTAAGMALRVLRHKVEVMLAWG